MLLNGAYLAALSTLALIELRRERRGDARSIPLREAPLLAAATFALAHVVAKEKVTTWLREPFVEEGADHRPVRPEGSGLRYAVGELVTCTRCIGSWCALGLVGLRTGSPAAGRAVSTVLAAAGANNVLQSGFRLLIEKTNKAEREAQALDP